MHGEEFRMPVSVSPNITDHQCKDAAQQHATTWKGALPTQTGAFEIQHGADQRCAAVHDQAFNGGFWIVTIPRGCMVFESNHGNRIDYAGAGNIAAYRGGCTCGSGH